MREEKVTTVDGSLETWGEPVEKLLVRTGVWVDRQKW